MEDDNFVIVAKDAHIPDNGTISLRVVFKGWWESLSREEAGQYTEYARSKTVPAAYAIADEMPTRKGEAKVWSEKRKEQQRAL